MIMIIILNQNKEFIMIIIIIINLTIVSKSLVCCNFLTCRVKSVSILLSLNRHKTHAHVYNNGQSLYTGSESW